MVRKSDLSDISQFEKEVEYQKMLDHPNICRLYDVYADKKCYYLCMEKCSGGELFDLIVKNKNFTENVAGIMAKQMLEGINYMHTVHRVAWDIPVRAVIVPVYLHTVTGILAYR